MSYRVIGPKKTVLDAAEKDGYGQGKLRQRGKGRDRSKTTVSKIEKPTKAHYLEAGLPSDSKETLFCYSRPKNWVKPKKAKVVRL